MICFDSLKYEIVKSHNKKIYYINLPCAFDIETSSFYQDGEKKAVMYLWCLGIDNNIVYGRSWEEFNDNIEYIVNFFELNENKRLIIYVHNLSYEFQFMRKWFDWSNVFALDNRKVCYAVTTSGIEFRCSYILSNYSLGKLDSLLLKHNIQKMTGAIDYTLLRHPTTQLTETEINYCVRDVEMVIAYISEEIENNEGIHNISLTATGKVRKYIKNLCLKSDTDKYKYLAYHSFIKSLRLTLQDYKQIRRAFAGGFTHSNPTHTNIVKYNVTSMDFTSSYPYVLLSELFPMSSPQKIKIESKKDFQEKLKYYCCFFEVEFTNIKSKIDFDFYISSSKCYTLINPTISNGRLVSAECIQMTITDVDYKIIEHCYSWDNMKIANFKICRKGYLPLDIIKAVLDFYAKKTELKGIKGKEYEYMKGKNMLNSCYGMMVTDVINNQFIYENDEWDNKFDDKTEEEIQQLEEEELEKYNESGGRFLYYLWGVWVTAYARYNLWTGIFQCKNDYIYADTDSIKLINYEKHIDYFEKYNKSVENKLKKMCNYYNIDYNKCKPKTKNGIEKLIGVWDFDGKYNKFKTLGAKRYLVEKENGEYEITISGVRKDTGINYLLEKYGEENIFTAFSDGLYFEKGTTGKQTHTYIDDEICGEVVDYLGGKGLYREKSFIHLEESDYNLGMGQFLEFIEMLKGGNIELC